jgi:hypothetical protein
MTPMPRDMTARLPVAQLKEVGATLQPGCLNCTLWLDQAGQPSHVIAKGFGPWCACSCHGKGGNGSSHHGGAA